jgi:hypothetical protein
VRRQAEGVLVKIGRVLLDATNELAGLKWVGVVELLVPVNQVGVGGDNPLVEDQITRADGGARVIQTDKGIGVHGDVPRSREMAGILLSIRIGMGLTCEKGAAACWRILAVMVQRRTFLDPGSEDEAG